MLFHTINSVVNTRGSAVTDDDLARVKVHNDIALSVDASWPVVLVLLDLTAAFDTVDHTVLLSCQNYIGTRGRFIYR